MPFLKFVNVEDADENSLRIRTSDLKANGFVKFKGVVYADPVPEFAWKPYEPSEEEEKQIWVTFTREIMEYYGHLTTEKMEPNFRDILSAGIVTIEFDHESGELTLKENKRCQSLTKANTSTQGVSSKQRTSKKTKQKSPSKSLKK